MSDPITAATTAPSEPFMQMAMNYVALGLIVVVLLVIAPFGTSAKKSMVDALPIAALTWPLGIAISFIAFVGASAAWDAKGTAGSSDVETVSRLRAELLCAVSFGTCFLGLLLRLSLVNLREISRLTQSLEAMKRQALQASEAYQREAAELEVLKTAVGKFGDDGDDGVGKSKKVDVVALLRTSQELDAKLAKKDEELRKTDVDLGVVKKQAKQQAEAHLALTDENIALREKLETAEANEKTAKELTEENKRLQSQLEDFDIVLGDTKKKKS